MILTVLLILIVGFVTGIKANTEEREEKKEESDNQFKINSKSNQNVKNKDVELLKFSEILDKIEQEYLEKENSKIQKTEIIEDDIVKKIVKISAQEIDMIEAVVQNEVNGLSKNHMKIITNVILNRVKSNNFPDSVYEVLHQSRQFPTINNYYTNKFPVTTEVKQAVEEVIYEDKDDISQGALYFYAPLITKEGLAGWFENNLTFLYEITEIINGKKYVHRFFK